jgi:hypothetical protein
MNRQSSVLEFPVTFEDEQPPGLAAHVASDLDVLRANADNDGINVLLIHTTDPADKVHAEEELLSLLPAGIEVSDMLSFARYWQARERLRWRVTGLGTTGIQLQVEAPLAIEGATFDTGAELSAATGIPDVKVSGQKLIFPALSAGQIARVRIHYRH